jgi:MFS transporter, PAT family, beta-lactamase induction signal transducer AmpG
MPRLKSAAESRALRLWLFTVLYFVQGIPSGFFLISLPGWFAQHGLSKAEIGKFIAIVTMPWAFKFIFAPLMDKIHFLRMGRRRPWIISTQLGIFACTLLMAAVPDPVHNLGTIALYGFLVNLFSSTQDLAVDGMAVDLLPKEEQARVQGFMIGGQAIGKTTASAGGALILLGWGYPAFVIVTAFVAGAGMLFPLLVRERPGESLLPWTPGRPSPEALGLQVDRWGTLLKSLLKAFLVPSSVVVVLALFLHRIPVGITRTVYPVVTVQELGWTNLQYSNLLGFATLASAIVAMFMGAILVDRIGRVQTIFATFGAVTLVFIVSGFFTSFWSERWFMSASAVLAEVLIVLSNVAFYAICMQLCWKKVAATQFALYMALNNLGVTAGAWLTGLLEKHLSVTQLFYVAAAFSVLTMLTMLFARVRRDEARIAAFDAESSGPPATDARLERAC